ncbi:MAG TPA: hypothetical protein VKS82_09435 [Streptosporangiaceae bacterium]|nr:hypothetical protein [Streptosporangiaceae bacterium]
MAIRFHGTTLKAACASLAAASVLYLMLVIWVAARNAQPRSYQVHPVDDAAGQVGGYLATNLLPSVTAPSPNAALSPVAGQHGQHILAGAESAAPGRVQVLAGAGIAGPAPDLSSHRGRAGVAPGVAVRAEPRSPQQRIGLARCQAQTRTQHLQAVRVIERKQDTAQVDEQHRLTITHPCYLPCLAHSMRTRYPDTSDADHRR